MSVQTNDHGHMVEFNSEKIQLLKDTICKGASDQELELFTNVCKRLGLDPFLKQIHPVKRWDSSLRREVMAFQTGIDGYRLIAERSGKYMPGKEPTFAYDKEGKIFSATSYVKKMGPDNQWHEIASTAFYSEYAAKTKEGRITGMWADKSHLMLAKCAEAAALRRAFPAEMCGVYTDEEMEQADNPVVNKNTGEMSKTVEIRGPTISIADAIRINEIIGDDTDYRNRILKHYMAQDFIDIEAKHFSLILQKATEHSQERAKKEMEMV